MKYILLLALSLISLFVNGQDPYLQESTAESEALSNLISEAYDGKLGMSLEQTTLFRNKLEEFVLRRQQITDMDAGVKEKLRLLRQLSKQETAEMGTILTRPQLRRYKKLKKEIQPVQLVVGEVGS